MPKSIPLEDDFCDILHKAMKGTAIDEARLAGETGLDAADIAGWRKGKGTPTDDAVRVLAHALHLDPTTLADSAAKRWYPPRVERDDVRRHDLLPHPSNGYVFFAGDPQCAALVDPAGVPDTLLRILREGEYQLRYILITHKHADHCDAAAAIATAFPEARIVMHRSDVHAIGGLADTSLLVTDGGDLPFGNGQWIRTLHTPGHTDGSTCYLFAGALFTGDMLFAGSVGGAYGDRSTYADILDSIQTKMFSLPDETVVMPGHGPTSTIALEKQHNPFFPKAIP